MADRLSIPHAEAMVLQAGLWPNPNVSIDEVNLWATQKQVQVFGEGLKGLGNSNFGRNQQISVSVEQLVFTAGKRKKLVALEQVGVEQSKQYFEELLRNLKLELRQQLTTMQYLQLNRGIYENQLQSVKQLTAAYQRQVQRGNIPRGEHTRLKALELELAKNANDLSQQIYAAQKELKLLLHLDPTTTLEILPAGFERDLKGFDQLSLHQLVLATKDHRPDLKLAQLDKDYSSRLYDYERAMRVPDLTLKGGYDRGGNFMYNFIGFGVSLDLPFTNRNQGNIKAAQIGLQQANLRQQLMVQTVEQEAVLAWQNVASSVAFLRSIEQDYEANLDDLLSGYTRAFTSRNISLLEYLDFMEAYLGNKKIILDATREVNERVEELNYTIGQDILK